jgi:hypothetical protein
MDPLRGCGLLGLVVVTVAAFCAAGQADSDRARPAEPARDGDADLAVDRELPMFLNIEDRKPVLSSEQNSDEATAYNYLVERAHKASIEAFARQARTDIRHYHLWNEPQKYRCEIVHVEGRLRQLWRYDAPKLAQNGGVRYLYEAWIRDDHDNENHWCAIFTDLPPGLEPDGEYGQHVSFDGYFFKMYRYRDRKQEARLAPLLIGHAPVVEVREVADEDVKRYFSQTFILWFLGMISAGVTVLLGLGWWLRRGDARVRRQLENVRASRFFEAEERGEPGT